MKTLDLLKEELERISLPLNHPHQLSEALVRRAILLAEFVNPLSDLEASYQRLRGEGYHNNLKLGLKPTPAKDQLDFDKELVDARVNVERWKAYVKAQENILFRAENHLKTEIQLERKGI